MRARVSDSVIDSLIVKSLNVESLTSAPILSGPTESIPPTNDRERFAAIGHIALASVYLSSKIDCSHSPATIFSDETGSNVCNVPAQLSISVTSLDKASNFSLVVNSLVVCL